jgi:hypothetical protein
MYTKSSHYLLGTDESKNCFTESCVQKACVRIAVYTGQCADVDL